VNTAILLLAGTVRIAVTGTALALVWWYARLYRRGLGARRTKADRILVLAAVAATALYFDFAFYPTPGFFINVHDVFHYYMGSKYAKEVGYLNLYPCAAVADWENNGRRSDIVRIRNMDSYQFVKAGAITRKADTYRALFSRERWDAFKEDVARFKALLGDTKAWRRALIDKGYNATPVWTLAAGLITNHVSAESVWGIALLVLLDVALLAATFAMVWRVFGWRTSLFAVTFVGTVFMLAYGHIRGAFLRLDWVCLLVMSCCMLKANRYKTAGAMAAYAGLARIFPFIFVFGLAAKAAWNLIATRKVERRYVEFFLTFAVVTAALVGLSVLDGGVEPWRAFWTKIRLHDADMAPSRVGFRYAFLLAYACKPGTWAAYEAAKVAQFREYQGLWWCIQATVLVVSLFAVRNLEDYETIPYGYALAYFLTASSFYYQVMLVTALFLFLPKLEQPARARGAALLFALSIFAYLFNAFWDIGLTLSFAQSCMLLVLSLYIIGVSFMAQAPVLRAADCASAAPPVSHGAEPGLPAPPA
jgi:hypothetical protein